MNRREALRAALETHQPKPSVMASPGWPGYGNGLRGYCWGCGWEGTLQTESKLATNEQRELALTESREHLLDEILKIVVKEA